MHVRYIQYARHFDHGNSKVASGEIYLLLLHDAWVKLHLDSTAWKEEEEEEEDEEDIYK